MVRYLAALGVDAFATSVLAVVALAHGGPGMIGLALVAAAGLWVAVLAAIEAPAGRIGRVGAWQLLIGGLVLNTLGSVAIGIGTLAGPSVHVAGEASRTTAALTVAAAAALLVIGDVLSVVYLRIVAVPRYDS